MSVAKARGLTVIVAVIALGLLGGCTSSNPAAPSTSSSPCFRALPAADTAVHHRGKLLGVRYLTVNQINADLRRTKQNHDVVTSPLARAKSSVCAVGYQGSFTRSDVENPWPPNRTKGSDVLVLVDLKDEHVLATVLLGRPPLRLSHL